MIELALGPRTVIRNMLWVQLSSEDFPFEWKMDP